MVFNLTGYQLMFAYLQNRAELSLSEKIDNNAYNPASLIEVKVPLHLPYPNNDKNFERYDGTVELNGFTYNYVERKVENDTLVLHCLPNNTSDDLKLASAEYGKAVNDIQPSQKGQKAAQASLLLKSLACAGYKVFNGFKHHDMFFAARFAAYKTISEKIVDPRFAKSPEQPPDTI